MILKWLGFLLLLGPSLSFPLEEAPLDEAPAVEASPQAETPLEEALTEAPMEEARTEAPLEESPPEAAPTEEAPLDEAPAEEAPLDEAPAEESPVEEAPTEESLPEEDPREEEAPAEEPPVEEAPAEESLPEEAPREEELQKVEESETAEGEANAEELENKEEPEELEVDLCKFKDGKLGLVSISFTETEESTFNIISVSPEVAPAGEGADAGVASDQDLLKQCLQSSNAREGRRRRNPSQMFNLNNLKSLRRSSLRPLNRISPLSSPFLRSPIGKLPRRTITPLNTRLNTFGLNMQTSPLLQQLQRNTLGLNMQTSPLLQQLQRNLGGLNTRLNPLLSQYQRNVPSIGSTDFLKNFKTRQQENKKKDKKRDEKKRKRNRTSNTNRTETKKTETKTPNQRASEMVENLKQRLQEYQVQSNNRGRFPATGSQYNNQFNQFSQIGNQFTRPNLRTNLLTSPILGHNSAISNRARFPSLGGLGSAGTQFNNPLAQFGPQFGTQFGTQFGSQLALRNRGQNFLSRFTGTGRDGEETESASDDLNLDFLDLLKPRDKYEASQLHDTQETPLEEEPSEPLEPVNPFKKIEISDNDSGIKKKERFPFRGGSDTQGSSSSSSSSSQLNNLLSKLGSQLALTNSGASLLSKFTGTGRDEAGEETKSKLEVLNSDLLDLLKPRDKSELSKLLDKQEIPLEEKAPSELVEPVKPFKKAEVQR